MRIILFFLGCVVCASCSFKLDPFRNPDARLVSRKEVREIIYKEDIPPTP